jgi:type IV pilus assembly protein PilV
MSLNTHQSGFTLLEVLVAIIVLSLGLLGLAGLQAASLRNNQIAYYRAIATQQTYDMADRIRANQAGVALGSYNNLTATIPADPDCVTNTCTPAQIAVADHSQWNNNNARMLPAGTGTVASVAGGSFNITVMWTEKDMGGAVDPNCPVGTPANTRCFVTRVVP